MTNSEFTKVLKIKTSLVELKAIKEQIAFLENKEADLRCIIEANLEADYKDENGSAMFKVSKSYEFSEDLNNFEKTTKLEVKQRKEQEIEGGTAKPLATKKVLTITLAK